MNQKADDRADVTVAFAQPRKGFAATRHGQVHFLKLGRGPDVVLLHDSPRSSRLHLDTMQALSARYTVYALDTPGYGMSDPLPIPQPSITDFAVALDHALEAMGLADAPIYATHTSAKIAIEHAALTGKPRRLVLDGLSIPDQLAEPSFVDAYMRPFVVEPTGAYLAAEWQRIRDMLRWFPWFSPSPANRMAMDRPDDMWIEQYTIDLFSAAQHYSDAYGAAMRYDPMPALLDVTVPTIVGARSSDVLYGFLDKVPFERNAALSVERLDADQDRWLGWIAQSLDCPDAQPTVHESSPPSDGALSYVDFDDGQILVRRRGKAGSTPLLILEAPGPFTAFAWRQALGEDRDCIIPELPGYGQSDALRSGAGIIDLVRALQEVLIHVGEPVDVLAIGHAGAIALALADADDRVRRVVLDGAPDADIDATKICPHFVFSTAGSHVHESFHMLRDWQVQYPWFARSASARRLTEPALDAQSLHRGLLGILKQPSRYRDTIELCQMTAQAGSVGTDKGSDVLIFTLPDDPFCQAAEALAATIAGSAIRSRPVDFAGAAKVAEQFLSSSR